MKFWQRATLFFFVFASLQLGWQGLRDTRIERWIVHDATVIPAAALVNRLTPNAHALAINFSINAPGGGLNVLNGCEGTEALFLLLAAFIVAAMPWWSRISGFLLGTLVVFVVNQVRIVALFYAFRANREWFDPLHGTVAPILVIIVVAGYFYGWLTRSVSRAAVAA